MLNGKYIYETAPWMTWKELLYGLEKGYTNSQGIIDYSINKLNKKSSQLEIELASMGFSPINYFDLLETLKKIVSNEHIEVNDMKESWVFLVFSWIYMNLSNFKDPFMVAEELYADFDYPEEVAQIIRYMPTKCEAIGSEDALYKNWEKLIQHYKKILSNRKNET